MATKESLRVESRIPGFRRIYLIHVYLGKEEIGAPSILSDSPTDLNWVEHWKNEAKRHHHPEYSIMVETFEVAKIEVITPEKPDPKYLA